MSASEQAPEELNTGTLLSSAEFKWTSELELEELYALCVPGWVDKVVLLLVL